MYWDIVEVIPEPDYCLFVRFKDGLSGRVRLNRKDLTGALGPLLDINFFRRVYIDSGAVAWPGNIDLVARCHVRSSGATQRTGAGILKALLHRFEAVFA